MHPIVIVQALRRFHRQRPRRQLVLRVVAVGQVFEDGPGFGQDQRPVLQNRRLAERMHLAQFRRRQPGLGVALVADHFVGQAKFFQHPQHALRARLFQMVHGNHRWLQLNSIEIEAAS